MREVEIFMHDTLKRSTSENSQERPRDSFEFLRDGDELDHSPFMSPDLKSPEDGTEFRIESERRMLNLETPRTLAEIKRDNAHLIGSNLEALRHQKLEEALQREQEFYGLEYERIKTKDDVRLAS